MSALTQKTHPMVLIAAIALTVFSILGSAMIAGLIPTAHSERVSEEERIPPNIVNASDKSNSGEQIELTDKNGVSGKISQSSQVDHLIASCQECGKVVSIKRIKTDGEASGLGAVAGGVTGGVVGNQIGKGQGNVLMTILGIGGGAYAGHTIEKKINAETAYVIKVKMENGEYKTVRQHHEPSFAIGDVVKLKNGSLISA